MFCERCGAETTRTTRICSVCGAEQNVSRYSHQTQRVYSNPIYQHTQTDEASHQTNARKDQATTNASSIPYRPYQEIPQTTITGPTENGYQSPCAPYNYNIANKEHEQILALELCFALCGIFGIGWIKARESTTGALLLACSIFLYWPMLIYGTIYTLGLGLICLSPLAISAIILDVLILKGFLKQREIHAQHPKTTSSGPDDPPHPRSFHS